MEALGESEARIEIGSYVSTCKALVVEQLPKALVLGNDFLRQTRAVINYDEGTITLQKGSETTTIHFRKDLNPSQSNEPTASLTCTLDTPQEIVTAETAPIKVVLARDYRLTPGVVTTIELTTDKPLNLTELYSYTFELNTKLTTEKHITIMGDLKESNGALKIDLALTAYKSPSLFQHCTLGYLHPAAPNKKTEVLLYNETDTPRVTPEDHNINKDLTDEQKQQFLSLLSEFTDVFAKRPEDIGRTNLVQGTGSNTNQAKAIQNITKRKRNNRPTDPRDVKK